MVAAFFPTIPVCATAGMASVTGGVEWFETETTGGAEWAAAAAPDDDLYSLAGEVPLHLLKPLPGISARVFVGQGLSASDSGTAPPSNPALSPPTPVIPLSQASLQREGFQLMGDGEVGMEFGESMELLELLDKLPNGDITSSGRAGLYESIEGGQWLTAQERDRARHLLEKLDRYVERLVAMIREAVPKERMSLSRIYLRWNSAYGLRKGAAAGFHYDNIYGVISVALVGEGTVIAHNNRYLQSSPGIPVFLTGRLRQRVTDIPATYHRAPSLGGQSRLVLLVELE
ncbi:MAG: hypothetical protein HY609_05300 [Deltaproteobacteria bacterium]|nr:hypothetical protein [Deltaproteobacteria bacterium]MBI4224329.1 hypothetical protein [Deltaproteobacteria bacterium]